MACPTHLQLSVTARPQAAAMGVWRPQDPRTGRTRWDYTWAMTANGVSTGKGLVTCRGPRSASSGGGRCPPGREAEGALAVCSVRLLYTSRSGLGELRGSLFGLHPADHLVSV